MSSSLTEPFAITGMTCDHCVGTVRRALESIPGVQSAQVQLHPGRAEVVLDPVLVNRDQIKTAIEAAGYQVTDRADPSPQVVTISLSPPQ